MANFDLTDGIYAAVLTPMRSDLSCDYKKLSEHCFSLLERGCTGVALLGTTGEGSSFSLAERIEILQQVVSAGLDPQKIIVANGSSNLVDTVEFGKEVVRHGCAAFLIAPPSFYKNIDDAGVLAFYREIIQRIGDPNLRVILYHIPQYSGVPISLDVIKTLRSEFPSIVIGIKESEKNLPFTKTLIKEFPGFKVFVANEKQIIEAVHLGAAGSICGIANLYPELVCSLYAQGKKRMSPNPEALEAIFNAIKGISFFGAAKAIMEKREGESWRALRPPLIPLSVEQREPLEHLERLVGENRKCTQSGDN